MEVEGDFTRATGREVARQLAADGVGADAVVCANDETAVGVLRVFASAGIAVPGDVIVTGFDGISDAAEHGLTTVQQPMRGLGATAIQLLVDRIGGVHKRPRVVRLAVEVRLRSSCGCVEPG